MSKERVYQERIEHIAAFRRMLRQLEISTEAVCRECGLTQARYVLLLHVRAGRGRSTVTALAAQLRMPHNTVSELVTRTMRAGLIERRGTPGDARSSQIVMTPEGNRRLRRAVDRLTDQRAELLDALARVET